MVTAFRAAQRVRQGHPWLAGAAPPGWWFAGPLNGQPLSPATQGWHGYSCHLPGEQRER